MLIKINMFVNKYAFLSNFYSCKGIKTVEHYYQSHKTDNDRQSRNIYLSDSPAMAKKLGNKVTLRKDWEKEKVNVMKNALALKFSPANPDLVEKLLATHPAKLVEGNHWHSNYWGDCYCDRCKGTKGKNVLGRLLMLLRIRLMKENRQ